MRFLLAVLQPNGEVGYRRAFGCAEVHAARREGRLVARMARLLRTRLRPAAHGGHELRAPLNRARDLWLEWFQPWSFAAVGTILAAGAPACTLAFLPGYYPSLEAPTLQVVEGLLAARRGQAVRSGLRSVEERPLVACMVGPSWPAGVGARAVVRWAICLAVAYFERAAERQAEMPPEPPHGPPPGEAASWPGPGDGPQPPA